MGQPKVSVIVPVYNADEFLAECLASIERQTLADIEIVCIDDGSSDQSLAILEEFARGDSRFRVERNPENLGVAATRNRAMDLVSGEYIAFMDSDDWYPEDSSLEKLYLAATAHGAAIAGGSIDELNTVTGEAITDYTGQGHQECFTFKKAGMVSYRDWQGDYGFTRFIYRTDLLRLHEIRFPLIRRHEDPVFLVKAMVAAGEFYAIPDVVYRIRIGYKDTNIGHEAFDEAFDGIAEVLALSFEHNLPKLRAWQKDLILWYMHQSREVIEDYFLPDLLRECGFRVARHLPRLR